MTLATRDGRATIEVAGIALDLIVMGEGRPLLYLHGGEGPDIPSDRHLRQLAAHYRVLAPWHPGFGRRMRPQGLREVADLAYLYLDLAEQLKMRDAVLVGASFGGWIAAEMLIRNQAAFSHLVLSGPLGIKVRDREACDIADVFAMTEEEFRSIAYADPEKGKRDLGGLDDEDLAAHFRSHESLAFFGWKPYMHNSQLKRWLHRITVPTLVVAGEQDRFVFAGYHAAFAASLPRSTLRMIGEAGHFPHIEQPEEFVRCVLDHGGRTAASTTRVAQA